MGSLTHDPLGHVMYAYPWGEAGTVLAGYAGPRRWQREFLSEIGDQLRAGETSPMEVIQEAVASGHGPGKSAIVAFLTRWAVDTCEDARVVITANTDRQLKTKTVPEFTKWHNLSITKHWWQLNATSLYSLQPGHDQTWRADFIPWNDAHPESFQGLHNQGKRIVVIFDEASAIADIIWESTEGTLTDEDTEIIWCAFGNPTRTTGRFRECFGTYRHRWSRGKQRHIDTREVEGTNKAQIEKWRVDHGEDSDFFRVRVKGQFPRASALQFISEELVTAAQEREPNFFEDDPLILSIDVARGGAANLVASFRRGFDARTKKGLSIPGSETRDSMRVVGVLAKLIEDEKPDAIFLDATGVGGPIADRLRQLGHEVTDVQFGAASPDPRYANLRTYMWAKALDALKAGIAIDKAPELKADLVGPEYFHDKHDRLCLESKEDMEVRGLASPDYGDSFCMTYAYPVPKKRLGISTRPITTKPDRKAYWERRGDQ